MPRVQRNSKQLPEYNVTSNASRDSGDVTGHRRRIVDSTPPHVWTLSVKPCLVSSAARKKETRAHKITRCAKACLRVFSCASRVDLDFDSVETFSSRSSASSRVSSANVSTSAHRPLLSCVTRESVKHLVYAPSFGRRPRASSESSCVPHFRASRRSETVSFSFVSSPFVLLFSESPSSSALAVKAPAYTHSSTARNAPGVTP